MSVTYAIRFAVIPEQRQRFLDLLAEVLDAMRSESTFREAVLHRDPENANRFLLVETWESHDDMVNVQIDRPYRSAYHTALPELLAEPRDITVWERTRADRRDGEWR